MTILNVSFDVYSLSHVTNKPLCHSCIDPLYLSTVYALYYYTLTILSTVFTKICTELLIVTDRGVGDSLVVGVGGARGTSRHFCGIRIEEKQFCRCGRNRIEGKPIAAGRRALLISSAGTASDSPDFNYIPNYTSFLMLIAPF